MRHDWPISHVAMRESDTFHLTRTLAQKHHGNPDRMKFVSALLMCHMADRLHVVFGLTIVIVEGLVGKTKHYDFYKNSHICLDLIWEFKV